MIKIVLGVLFVFNLFAFDYVNEYRLNGLKDLQTKLEKELQSKEYWNKFFTNIDVDYGWYENKKFVILADKSKPEFNLYRYENNKFILDSKLSAFVGEIKGDKQEEGDLKTPIGSYDLIKQKNDVDEFYGPLAFVTSYPNLYDRLQGKTGHGIWIHGLPLNQKRDDYTKGCIAIDNKYLESLSEKIDYKKSILITSENSIDKISKDDIALIMSTIYQWRNAWAKTNFNKYISFYSDKFKRFDGKNLKQFKRYKKSVFRNKSNKKIVFSNFNISPYPTVDGSKKFKVEFFEIYRSKTISFSGYKELYVSIKSNKMKILVEK